MTHGKQWREDKEIMCTKEYIGYCHTTKHRSRGSDE